MEHNYELLSNMNNNADTKFPPGFITLPNLEHQFSTIRNTTGALIIAYMPMVESKDLGLWNQYSEANQDWISKSNGDDSGFNQIFPYIWMYSDEDYDQRKLSGGTVYEVDVHHQHQHQRDLLVATPTTSSSQQRELQEDDDDEVPHITVTVDQGPFAPIWTCSPPPTPKETDSINYNLFGRSAFQTAVDLIGITREATFLDVGNQAAWFGHEEHAEDLQTVIAHPVFDDFDHHQGNIIGHLTAIVPWTVIFNDILHGQEDETKPIHLVLENSCGEVFTLEVMNEHATVLDPENDAHDSCYDYLKMSRTFVDFANPATLANDVNHCVYTINAYPTAEFEDEYLTKAPGFYTLLVLCIMLSTTLFFLLFDFLVQRRQGQVLAMALKQNAIVSSLFPKNVQAKMLAEVDQETSRLSAVGKAGIKSYLKDSTGSGGGAGSGKMDKSKPIADLFPEVTIMFADIAG